MKKLAIVLCVVGALAACNSNGTINEQKIDEAGDKLQNTVEKTADTIVSKVDKWTDSLSKRKDTVIINH